MPTLRDEDDVLLKLLLLPGERCPAAVLAEECEEEVLEEKKNALLLPAAVLATSKRSSARDLAPRDVELTRLSPLS